MNEIIINSDGDIKIDLTLNPSEITQTGTPTPESPVDVNVIKGDNTITISNSNNTQSQNYSINLGNLEYGKIGNYEDEIIETTGKNLFNKDNENTINAYFNSANTNTITSSNNAKTIYISCEKNTTYTISKITSARFYVGYVNELPTIGTEVFGRTGANNRTSPITITTGENAKYLVAFIYFATAETLTEQEILDTIMINEGEEPLPYEPYGVGELYLKENVGKVVLDGTETYTSMWFYPDAPRFGVATDLPNALTTTSASQFIQMYSNRFLSQKQEDLWTAGLYSDGICMRANNAQLIIKNNDISTPATSTEMINDFKNWISTHNIKVYYPMTTPIFKKITDTTLIGQLENIYNNPKTYDNETIIKQVNDGLPFDISYKLDKNIVSVISDINEFLRVNL